MLNQARVVWIIAKDFRPIMAHFLFFVFFKPSSLAAVIKISQVYKTFFFNCEKTTF